MYYKAFIILIVSGADIDAIVQTQDLRKSKYSPMCMVLGPTGRPMWTSYNPAVNVKESGFLPHVLRHHLTVCTLPAVVLVKTYTGADDTNLQQRILTVAQALEEVAC